MNADALGQKRLLHLTEGGRCAGRLFRSGHDSGALPFQMPNALQTPRRSCIARLCTAQSVAA